jgi:hypothetical protein
MRINPPDQVQLEAGRAEPLAELDGERVDRQERALGVGRIGGRIGGGHG